MMFMPVTKQQQKNLSWDTSVSDRQYLSFNGVNVTCREKDFLQLFFNGLLIETLLEGHSYILIQKTLKKGEVKCKYYYNYLLSS